MTAIYCPGCGRPGNPCSSATCRAHRLPESENRAPLTDLRTLCIIVGCLTPRTGANLCRSHDLASNPWRDTRD